MCKLELIEKNGDFNFSKDLIEGKLFLQMKEYIFMNPDAIYDFISSNKEYIPYLNEVCDYINVYFPNSEKYLKYDEHPESYELDSIVIYVVNKEKSLDENYMLKELLRVDLRELKDKFPEISKRAIIFVEEDDDYCKGAMSCYEKYGYF
ncbi:MAG: hypothetical protein IKV87_07625 [Methanobrevibacter sp.]|nr:hypothetical protein [Methanobrevibacter sp.]